MNHFEGHTGQAVQCRVHAQCNRSRATLDATEHCDWASIRPVSPQRTLA